MDLITHEAEEKRKRLLAKEFLIKRNLASVWKINNVSPLFDEIIRFVVSNNKALHDAIELFIDATELCSQLDW